MRIKMGPQYPVLLLVTILLIPAACLADRHQKFNRRGNPRLQPRPRSSLADPNPSDTVCVIESSDVELWFEIDYCTNPTDLCGIDKATGKVQGCVPASQCPTGTGKTLSCDPGKPSCCCRSTYAEDENDETLCNHVWRREDTSKCKQACSLPELKNFDFCKIKFTDTVWCAFEYEDGDFYDIDPTDCYASQFCGIDRITGRLQGCVNDTLCPTGVQGSKKLRCDSTKASCCCQQITPGTGNQPYVECNNVKHPTDTSVRKEACRLPELKNLLICKADSTKRVKCMHKNWQDQLETEECNPWEMCAIDKSSGAMKSCLDASKCPAKAFGSEKVVCDGSSPNCCCQKAQNPGDKDQPCNDLVNDKDSSIWQQACSLPELKTLDICKNDPSKRVTCTHARYGAIVNKATCGTSELCGIDKNDNGAMIKCVDPRKCPAGAKGSEKIVCDDKAPYCCCQKIEGKYDSQQGLCNDIINNRDASKWKQACSLPQLKNLPFCQDDPSKHVDCSVGGVSGGVYEVTCASSNLCGIDKTNGELKGCVDSKKCPGNAKNSDSMVCDAKAPFCCCQNVDDNYIGDDYTPDHPCNELLNEKDSKKWKETCKLKELSSLPICQNDPTKTVACSYYDGQLKRAGCKENEMCGIDKSNGDMVKCLAPSQCPAGAKGSEKIVCDASAPNCCCQKVEHKDSAEKHPCNNILKKEDSKIWEQACSLAELKGLPVCQDDPNKRVSCKYDYFYTEGCKPSEFCGIDKNDGKVHRCLDASECPVGAKGSKKVVCDSSATFCCCQDVESKYGDEHPCNHIYNTRDSTIWQQACSLPELSSLDVCVDDPSKRIFCSYKDDKGEVTMNKCRPSEFCGINKTDGEMKQCVDRSVCPPNVKGSAKVVCDANAPFCCCQDLLGIDEYSGNPCNNILNWEDTSVWEQACKLPELKPLEVCKSKPTKPTTPPPPTAPPTPTPPPPTPGPVKPEDMDSECLNFCKDEKPDDHPYLFRVYCGDAKAENTCPSPCPSACGKFCWDGRHMECPPFGGGPPPPPPRESEPSRGTDYVDLKASEAGFYAAFTIISLLVLLIFAGCIYLCCMSSGTVVAPLPFAAIQQQRQAMAFNSSTAATSSGTSLSSSESSLSSIAIKR